MEDGRPDLANLVLRRVDELIAYQGPAYAQRYADEVERVRAREAEATGTTELTRAVARHLYQLMAYKDEYEVARLSLDPALDESLRAEFGDGYRATYRLHPPMLRALGVRRKLSLGRWFRAVFALLYALRFVRGTPFDLFGYAKVRRVERALVGEYVDAVSRQLATLAPHTLARAVQVAELPDLVRGYEDIKLSNVDRYRAELARVESEGAAQSELAQP